MQQDQVELLKKNIVDIIDGCLKLDTDDNQLSIFDYLGDVINVFGDLAHDIDTENYKKIERILTAYEQGDFEED